MNRAQSNTNATAPASLLVEIMDWGWIYAGLRDELLAAGVVPPSCFPGEPGQFKTTGHGEIGGRKITVRAKKPNSRNGKFEVWVEFNAADRVRADARETLEKARAAEARELARVPSSRESFRSGMKARLIDVLTYVRAAAAGAAGLTGGYRYAPEALEAYDEAALDLIATLLSGRTLFDAEARDRELAKIKGKTAKADLPLQRFLELVTQPPDEHQGVN